jgi:hypothetical protein
VILPIVENQLTGPTASGRIDLRMFDGKGTLGMTTGTYAAQANRMAGQARVRVLQPCMRLSIVSPWSALSLDAHTAKHGRPRRIEVSHP